MSILLRICWTSILVLFLTGCATIKKPTVSPQLIQGKRYFEEGYYKRAICTLLPLAVDGISQTHQEGRCCYLTKFSVRPVHGPQYQHRHRETDGCNQGITDSAMKNSKCNLTWGPGRPKRVKRQLEDFPHQMQGHAHKRVSGDCRTQVNKTGPA